ncbi:hypothetical protein Hanom_Chr13g01228921 [Helianthus anomalus]
MPSLSSTEPVYLPLCTLFASCPVSQTSLVPPVNKKRNLFSKEMVFECAS